MEKLHLYTVAFIHIKDKKALLTMPKNKGAFYMAGGKKESDEDDHQALIREVKEELSIDLNPDTITYYGTFEAQAYGKPRGTLVRIACYMGMFKGEVVPSAEIDKVDYFTYDEYMQMNQTAPAVVLILQDLKHKKLIE